MNKILIVTHVSGFLPQFEMHNVRILQKLGYEVHYASNFRNVHYGADNNRLGGTGIVQHQVDFSRSPRNFRTNLQAYRQLKRLMEEQHFSMVHCHTPVASVVTRLAARKHRRTGTRVLYTAHGFHFYTGAPWKYWLIYPIERLMAHFTDALITINEEDYRRAQGFRLAKRAGKRGNVYRIDGVGIDPATYAAAAGLRERKRQELGLGPDTFALVSVGELNRNKNHTLAVEALGRLKHLDIRYIICGEGPERAALQAQAERLGVADRLMLLGFREDIPELLAAADAMAFPSVREGLGLVAVEALAAGLPVIATDNRGTREYMRDGENGYVIAAATAEAMAEAIGKLYKLSKAEYKDMKQRCKLTAERYDKESIGRRMEAIYRAEQDATTGGLHESRDKEGIHIRCDGSV